MRIKGIGIENFQGAETVDLQLSTPLAILAGGNGAGKSSVAEAIELALRGEPVRVSLKKHYGQLVTDGAKVGAIDVTFEHDQRAASVGISLPDGTRSGEEHVPTSPALPFVLNPSRFAAAKPDERRTLLFSLTGIAAKPDEIERRMLARGCRQDLITVMKPILRSGFAAGADFAKKQATEAKGAWRGVTGETWGSQKAVGWQAPSPAYDEAELDAKTVVVGRLGQEIEALAQALGGLEEKAKAHAAHAETETRQKALAGSLPSLRAKLDHDEAELASWKGKVEALQSRAGTGPREGLVHDLARSVAYLLSFVNLEGESAEDRAAMAALTDYESRYGKLDAQGDPEASAELPRAIQARDLMERSVANDRRDIAAAEAAAAQAAQDAPPVVDEADLAAAHANLAAKRAEYKAALEALQQVQDLKVQADGAATKTKEASAYHADVTGWTALGDALSPDGIPGDLLAEALAPLNSRLDGTADLTAWPRVQIDRDMTITAGGRVYGLLSESERWRADAAIGEALARLSGLRFLVLDRFDVLDLDGRADLLGWLDELAARGEIDTGLILGTLKRAPASPSPAFTVHWVGSGALADDPQQLREAA
ncbi:AAA family ATPase [Achromobacter aloeverae]